MRSGMASRARQVLLLCALTLSVLGMHHVALPPHESAHSATTAESMTMTTPAMTTTVPTAQPADDSGTGMGHDLLHLCLVVLTAAVVFLIGTWLLATIKVAWADPGDQHGAAFPRPPSIAGRSLLASVCVLRI